MITIIASFVAGMMFGGLALFVSLALLGNSRNDENESPFNEDGTPKRIIFNKNDL